MVSLSSMFAQLLVSYYRSSMFVPDVNEMYQSLFHAATSIYLSLFTTFHSTCISVARPSQRYEVLELGARANTEISFILQS